jgi:hypothetical protein
MGLFSLGLLIAAGSLTISCGGSDEPGDESSTAGTSNAASGSSSGGSGTSGSATTAGTSGNGGTSSTAGSSNGGTSSTAGSNNNNGGTTSNGGRNNGGGGDDSGPFPGSGGDGGFDLDACDAAVMDGGVCEQGAQACENAAGDTCFCSGQGGGDRQWNCVGFGGGDGGAGPGGLGAECPDNAADGDECEGFGACTGQAGCSCRQGEVNCE